MPSLILIKIPTMKEIASSMGSIMIYYNSGTRHYFNDEAKLACIYSHLVCASKFTMPPTSHNIRGSYPTFELLIETLQLIKKALEDLRLINGDM
jgi:hypothetical protein